MSAPAPTFFAWSVVLWTRTFSSGVVCETCPVTSYDRWPIRSETALNVSRRLSFEFSLRVDSSTLSTTLLPAGIIAPSDPDTEPSRTAVKRSPGLKVLVHTRATGRTPNEVPALTAPIAGAGGTFEVGAPAPVAAADDGEFPAGDALSCAFSGLTTTCGCATSFGLGGSDLAASAGFGAALLVAGGVDAAAEAGASFSWGRSEEH